jgi:hypothetical protein
MASWMMLSVTLSAPSWTHAIASVSIAWRGFAFARHLIQQSLHFFTHNRQRSSYVQRMLVVVAICL